MSALAPIGIDFETRGVVDLPKAGLDRYVRDTNTSVLCLAYQQPADRSIAIWTPGQPIPSDLAQWVAAGNPVSGWNVLFEYQFWKHHLEPLGWPVLTRDQCVDTMAAAQAMALPGHLAEAAKALRLPSPFLKDEVGHRLMLRVSKPRRIQPDGTPVWWTDPERLSRLYAYCRQDVVTEQAIAARLRELPATERTIWSLTHTINDRGIQVDTRLAQGARQVTQARVAELNSELRMITQGEVKVATNVNQLKGWLSRKIPGMSPDDVLDKAEVRGRLAELDLDPAARRVLEIRQEVGKSSTAKINSLLKRVSPDGRLRGMFRYHGAGSTGRWSGTAVQLQNLPRAKIRPKSALKLMADGDAAAVADLCGDVMTAVSASLRPMLTAGPGRVLVVADWSSIESRFTSWLAGDEAKLNVFRLGRDIYQAVGSGMYQLSEADIVGELRQTAKVAELACGFGGGPGALDTMARAYGVTLSEAEREDTVRRWRDANGLTARLWSTLRSAAMMAMESPGRKIDAASKRVVYLFKAGHLWCRLPSGRWICYPWARLGTQQAPWDSTRELPAILYEGPDKYTRQWGERVAWHGVLTENIVQGGCADLLRFALLNLEDAGFQTVGHVHDEIIADEETDRLAEMIRIMCRVPGWAEGLPLRAEGYAAFRYRKA